MFVLVVHKAWLTSGGCASENSSASPRAVRRRAVKDPRDYGRGHPGPRPTGTSQPKFPTTTTLPPACSSLPCQVTNASRYISGGFPDPAASASPQFRYGRRNHQPGGQITSRAKCPESGRHEPADSTTAQPHTATSANRSLLAQAADQPETESARSYPWRREVLPTAPRTHETRPIGPGLTC